MGFVGDVMEGISDVLSTITPLPEEATDIISGVTLGLATGGIVGAGIGASMATSLTIGGLAGLEFGMSAHAAESRKQALEKQRQQAEEQARRARQEQQQELAKRRRAILAQQDIQGAIMTSPTDVAYEKRDYKNIIPSVGGSINMGDTRR